MHYGQESILPVVTLATKKKKTLIYRHLQIFTNIYRYFILTDCLHTWNVKNYWLRNFLVFLNKIIILSINKFIPNENKLQAVKISLVLDYIWTLQNQSTSHETLLFFVNRVGIIYEYKQYNVFSTFLLNIYFTVDLVE